MAPSATTTNLEYESSLLNRESLIISNSHHNGSQISKELVKGALEERAENVNTDVCEPGEEDAFFVADMGEVYRQHIRWKMNLKRVKPHYGKLCTTCGGAACTDLRQPSNAIRTLKYFACLRHSAQDLTVLQRPRSSRSLALELSLRESSMLSLARPSRTYDMPLSKV